jgi:hypothetical protein
MQLSDVMVEVFSKAIAAEFCVLEVVRIRRFSWYLCDAGLLFESIDRRFGPVMFDGPALTVNPDSIDFVFVPEFF